nr:MAG TPA: hypothetical protein [Caudoviricetes sp.]
MRGYIALSSKWNPCARLSLRRYSGQQPLGMVRPSPLCVQVEKR